MMAGRIAPRWTTERGMALNHTQRRAKDNLVRGWRMAHEQKEDIFSGALGNFTTIFHTHLYFPFLFGLFFFHRQILFNSHVLNHCPHPLIPDATHRISTCIIDCPFASTPRSPFLCRLFKFTTHTFCEPGRVSSLWHHSDISTCIQYPLSRFVCAEQNGVNT